MSFRSFKLLAIAALAVAHCPQAFAQTLPVKPARVVVNGTLPTDEKYWEFNRWYRTNSTVDVLVNGEDRNQLDSVLTELTNLKKRGVAIRSLTVIGGNSFALLDLSTRTQAAVTGGSTNMAYERLGVSPSLAAKAAEIELGEGSSYSGVADWLKQLGVTASPTWIVTVRGNRHIFEGVDNLSKQFSRVGEFRAGENEEHLVKMSEVKLLAASAASQTYRYSVIDQKLRPGAGTYDAKPDCPAGAVRRVAVLYDTKELDDFDLTYYNYEDPKQSAAASQLRTPTAPYLVGDMYNPYRDKRSLQQNFARFFDVRCLPTRLHYVYEGSRRFEEYREGEAAWEPDSAGQVSPDRK